MSYPIWVNGNADGTNVVIGLNAAADNTKRHKVGHLKLRAVKIGGAEAEIIIKPLTLSEDDDDPTAATLAAPAVGSADGLLYMFSDKNSELELGQLFAPGYNPQANGPPVATHLQITFVKAGALQVIVD